jgi:dihydroceramide fatty acyl 2-hydroxylase
VTGMRGEEGAGRGLGLLLESPPMASERTARLSASPPLFESRFLDFFSRIHPSVPALIYLPVIAALITFAARDGAGVLEIVLLGLAGVVLWTLAEYWLHRKLFHWEPDHPLGRRLHFIIHGVHHEHPNDKLRLVMPPGASIPLAVLFFGLFYLAFGLPTALPIFAGFLLGYLIYDYTHYYVHHYVPKSNLGKRVREQHMRHHFQDHRFGFGVSSPLWDVVFGTLPRRRAR